MTLVVLISFITMNAFKSIRQNKRAIIFSFGFILFAFISISSFVWKNDGLFYEPPQKNEPKAPITKPVVEPAPPAAGDLNETGKKVPETTEEPPKNNTEIPPVNGNPDQNQDNPPKPPADPPKPPADPPKPPADPPKPAVNVKKKKKPDPKPKEKLIVIKNGIKTIKPSEPYKSLFVAPEKPEVTKDSDISELPEVAPRDIETVGIVGITNRGNSCYADSVIQILFRIPAYRKLVANFEMYRSVAEEMIRKAEEGIPAAEAARAAYTGTDSKTITDLTNGVDNLKKIIPYYKKRISILEGLNHIFHQLQNNPKGNAAVFSFDKSEQCMQGTFHRTDQEDADEYFWEVYQAPLNFISPGQKLRHFEIKLERISKYIAKDGANNPNHNDIVETNNMPEDSLRFMFPKDQLSKGKFTLKGFLDDFFAVQTREYKFKGEVEAQGTLRITKKIKTLPPIVPVILNRADYNEEGRKIKIHDRVSMPDQVDFAPYFKTGYNSGHTKYRLKMFIMHFGSTLNSGHYVAFSRESDGNWYELNDSQVHLIPKRSQSEKDFTGYFVNETDGKIYNRKVTKQGKKAPKIEDSSINDAAYIYFYERI